MGIDGFKIIARHESNEKNTARFEWFSEQVQEIRQKTEQIKLKYGAENTEMSSFSPDLLPTSERPALLSQEVFDDYRKLLEKTRTDGKEHNFVWFGRKEVLDGQEYYTIEKAVAVPEDENTLQQSEISPFPKINIYSETENHLSYDVIVDGHTHPLQDPTYKGFDQLPQPLLDELSLKKPGENFSISDLDHYAGLLSVDEVGKAQKIKLSLAQ